MVATVLPAKPERDDHIDTLRGLACIMLVLFHVVGFGPDSGLGIDYPSPLRIFNDSLIVIRMPLFAFIAGYVYAIRPATRGTLPKFAAGKLRRLAIPGVTAISVFLVLSRVMGTRFALPLDEVWRAYVLPYAHFWFLRAILAILLLFAAIDVFLQYRGTIVLLAAAYAVALCNFRVISMATASDATMLAPYFLLGVLCRRRLFGRLHDWRLAMVLIGALFAALFYVKYLEYLRWGGISQNRTSAEALVWGTIACIVMYCALPRIGAIAWLGPYTFTIYLYHVLGTAASRELLEPIGWLPLASRVLLGVIAGLALPILAHVLCGRSDLLRRMVLGLRPVTGRRQPAVAE